jgi:hypothetical protein
MADKIFDKIAALADTTDLGTFDGKPVLQCGTKLRNAGDGLSKAMKIAPMIIQQGDEVYLLTKGVCTEVEFVPIDKDDPKGPQKRVHVIRAGTQMLVDDDVAGAQIEAQETRIREAIEKAQGIEPMPDIVEGEKADKAKKAAKRGSKKTGVAEAAADSGKKPVPAPPVGDGPHDADGFHDPAVGAPVADLAKAAAKKLADQ